MQVRIKLNCIIDCHIIFSRVMNDKSIPTKVNKDVIILQGETLKNCNK